MASLYTKSVCPVCLRVIDAVYTEQRIGKDNEQWSGMFLNKSCPDHGFFSTLVWEDSKEAFLDLLEKESEGKKTAYGKKKKDKGCPYDCGLCEEHLQESCCVLLEVTNRCNLNCPVCFASASAKGTKDPSLDDIRESLQDMLQTGGPFNLQLSGGEPTVRDDLATIIRMAKQMGFQYIQLNTNGIRIALEEGYLLELKEAGLDSVFLQFDGLTDASYQYLRGRDLLEMKDMVIEICQKVQMGVVLVCTLTPDVNLDQIGPLIQFALDKLPVIRGVHFQPISYFGRLKEEAPVHRVTIPYVLREIENQTEGLMKKADFKNSRAEHGLCSFHGSFLKKPDGSVRVNRPGETDSDCSARAAQHYVAARWKKPEEAGTHSCSCEDAKEQYSIQSLDDFMSLIHSQTLVISGMAFQDAYTLDLNRLKNCIVHESGNQGERIPFCAYNLTNVFGESLYRKMR